MQIEFSVGAKAARLIGRENIADVDGALVELIKNAYDADASCVWVDFSMPFPDIPDTTELSYLKDTLSPEDFLFVSRFYEEDHESEKKTQWVRRESLEEEEKRELQKVLFRYNRIVVLDNGSGMNEETVKGAWMHIGTSNKEMQSTSPRKHRVRTGAKGIGRFALDKLSTVSQVYTQTEEEKTALSWRMDWDQFAGAHLINEVKASLERTEDSYEDLVKELAGEEFDGLTGHDWSCGTAIILSPVREAWSDRLYQKVNTNLRSINPIGSVDRFDVIVHNRYCPEYNYKTERIAISREDFDYRIRISYDGDEALQIKLLRNEVDIRKKTVTVKNVITGITKTCMLEDFWNRPALQKEGHTRKDYEKEITLERNILTLFKRDKKERVKEVGAFSAELYFLRNANSEHQVMKRVNRRKRKKLLDQFSGVKIYRDDFKVRPYGDDGPMQDWIGMGSRAQKSPASVAHTTGAWRVQPYQMIGFVRISREKNPLLQDMANREGIALTGTYYIFVDILRECLKDFEFDRQYIYREYARWIEEQENSIRSTADKVKAAAMKKAKGKGAEEEAEPETEEGPSAREDDSGEDGQRGQTDEGFTEEDYLETVYDMMQDSQRELASKQIMQILSASGIVLNTFFHEFNAINTQFHVRTSQMKSRIDNLLDGRPYEGPAAYDPYYYVEQTLEKNDKLVAAMLDVIMQGLKKPNLVKQRISLEKLTQSILDQWALLLAEKYISVLSECKEKEGCLYDIAVVDWYIILNNFLLNAAWFLEQGENAERQVIFKLNEDEKSICVDMENNGPPLAEKYQNDPDRIFELGETSKGEAGTGLGLWVVKETVERNAGHIQVKEMEKGFGLRIVFSKE